MRRHAIYRVVRSALQQSRAALDTYSIRISLGFVASLLLLVVLTHLPVYTAPQFVGWGPGTTQERIYLTELSTETPEQTPTRRQTTDVPATIQEPPRTAEPEPVEPAPESPPEETTTAPSEDASSETLYAAQLETMGPNNQRPQIVGGRGSFYLSIEYPEEARRQGIQGRVILDFIVDVDGRTQDIRVLKSLHPLCDSSAVAALERTRFIPGQRDGEKIPVRMRLPIRFQLVNLTAEQESTRTPSPPTDAHQ